MEELTFPITLDYVPTWGKWELAREIISNAKDTLTPVSVYLDNEALVVEDSGVSPLEVKHLLLGKTQKDGNDNAIGQFGEGLKLALLVATRLGMPVTITSHKTEYHSHKAVLAGEDVLRVTWDVAPIALSGTRVRVEGWGADSPTFEDRFILESEEDYRVIRSNAHGALLVKGSGLFVKECWVCELPNYSFGYNLANVHMNRDRSAVSEQEVHNGVGRFWQLEESPIAWEMFFRACKAGCGERIINLYNLGQVVESAIKAGFQKVYGEKMVLYTNDESKKEAEHRGASVLDVGVFSYSLQNRIKESGIMTDSEYITFTGGIKHKVISPRGLTPEQKKVLAMLTKIARKTACTYGLEVAELPHPGECDHDAQKIRVSIDLLTEESAVKAKTVMIHEVAHALYGNRDMTEEFNRDCCRVGVLLMD